MPETPTFEFPYPSGDDAPNGPAQIQALAEAVEDEVEGHACVLRLSGTQTSNAGDGADFLGKSPSLWTEEYDPRGMHTTGSEGAAAGSRITLPTPGVWLANLSIYQVDPTSAPSSGTFGAMIVQPPEGITYAEGRHDPWVSAGAGGDTLWLPPITALFYLSQAAIDADGPIYLEPWIVNDTDRNCTIAGSSVNKTLWSVARIAR